MSERPERPLPPVLVNQTHYSIELEWEHIKTQDKNRLRHRKLFDETGAAYPGTLIYLHQREKKSNAIWESVYIGSALESNIQNLKANSQYEFRIQYKSGRNGERSEWSPVLLVSTTSEPMNGETVFKAVSMPGKEQLEKLIKILGAGHPLLEHPNKDGNYPLMQACAKLDIGKVELLLKAGVNVNNALSSGKTALSFAASAGFSKACAMLLEYDANIYALDQNGMTILHHAIDSKNFETISVIVKYLNREQDESIRIFEMNREVSIHKWTPLYRAVIHDCNKEIIELLLNNHANAQCQDKTSGTSALQMAIIRANLPTTQLLVAHGANTKALSKVGGKTLQDLASATNKMDLINYVDSLSGSLRM